MKIHLLLLALGALLGSPAFAGDGGSDVSGKGEKGARRADSAVKASLHGDVKTFFVGGVPYQWFGLSDGAVSDLKAIGLAEEEALDLYGLSADPFVQCITSARIKMGAAWKDALRLDVHWELSIQSPQQATVIPGMSSGVVLTAPEAIRLTWTPDTNDGMIVRHRVDRLALSAKLPHVDVTLGRQPISFGTGYFFTPLDLVNPFHPATIDTEYKPGVDALRIDGYAGTSSKLTLAAAYAGDAPLFGEDRRDEDKPMLDDLVLALLAQGTLRVTDLIGFIGVVHGEPVFGLGTSSSLGPVGLHAEATLTLQKGDRSTQDEDAPGPFVRAVAGAEWRPTGTTSLMGEVYLQTFGAASPDVYLEVVKDARFTRGEVWQMGQAYAALSVLQEITPLLSGNVALLGNVRDSSALVVAGVSWSVAGDVAVGLGTFLGLGERPDEVDFDVALDPQTMAPILVEPTEDVLNQSVNSEFGLYPEVFYLQMRMYF